MTTPLFENKYINLSGQEIDAVAELLHTRQLSGTSPAVSAYEEALRDYFQADHAVAVSSGTAALHAVLYAYDIGPGDEVLLPPTAPVMSVLPILAVNAVPVFVDVENSGFGLDLSSLERAITARTRMVINVPMWGYPTNVEEQALYLSERGIPLIEDASHAHGTTESSGRLTGTVGETSFFSTQERKLVSTGEGGFILTKSSTVARRLREIREFGKIDPSHPTLAHVAGNYGHLFGLNFRITGASAALGSVQIQRLEDKIAQRTSNARKLETAVERLTQDLIPQEFKEGSRPNFYSLVLRTNTLEDNRELGHKLYERGVVSDIYRFGGVPLNQMPAFKKFARAATPNADTALSHFVTLPTHEGLDEEDLNHIINALGTSLEGINESA